MPNEKEEPVGEGAAPAPQKRSSSWGKAAAERLEIKRLNSRYDLEMGNSQVRQWAAEVKIGQWDSSLTEGYDVYDDWINHKDFPNTDKAIIIGIE